MRERPLWFKAKRYGWGWYPCSWQGWAVLLIALAAILINTLMVDAYAHSVSDVLIGSTVQNFLVIVLLIVIADLSGEKPRWRWGRKD